MLVIDKIFIIVVVEIASNTCKVNIHVEIGSLRFKYLGQRSVSTDYLTKTPETSYHYENTPIQIHRKYHLQKLKIFR